MLPMLRRKGVCIGSIFYAVIPLFRLFKNTRPLHLLCRIFLKNLALNVFRAPSLCAGGRHGVECHPAGILLPKLL